MCVCVWGGALIISAFAVATQLLAGGGVINGYGIRVYIPRVYICFAVLPTYCNLKRFTEAELVDIFNLLFLLYSYYVLLMYLIQTKEQDFVLRVTPR